MPTVAKTSRELDDIDISILQTLAVDGRITMRELAQRVNLSPPATTERVRRLEEGGFISGYRAVLSPDHLGLGVHAYIIVDNLPLGKRKQFFEMLKEESAVVSVEQLMSGGKEAILDVYCSELGQLQLLHSHLLDTIGSVFTTLVCDTKKYKDAILPFELAK